LLSAARDERVYQRPGEFDIMREDLPRTNIGFGGGMHRCLGESLALAELEESLIALTQRIPQLRLAGGQPQIRGHSGVRRIEGMKGFGGAQACKYQILECTIPQSLGGGKRSMTFGGRSIPPQQGQQPAQKGNRRRRAPRYQTSTGTTVAAPQ